MFFSVLFPFLDECMFFISYKKSILHWLVNISWCELSEPVENMFPASCCWFCSIEITFFLIIFTSTKHKLLSRTVKVRNTSKQKVVQCKDPASPSHCNSVSWVDRHCHVLSFVLLCFQVLGSFLSCFFPCHIKPHSSHLFFCSTAAPHHQSLPHSI